MGICQNKGSGGLRLEILPKVSRGLYDISLILQILILAFLTGLSTLATVEFRRAPDKVDVFTEYLKYRGSSILFPILFCLIALLLFLVSHALLRIDDKRLLLIVFSATFIIQIVWISSLSLTNYWYADSINLMRASDAIINHDWAKFSSASCAYKSGEELATCLSNPDMYKGNLHQYFSWYPFQAGPLMWFVFVFYIFGSFNVLAFQIVNAAFVSGMAVLMIRISQQFGLNKYGLRVLSVILMTCLPFLMFSAFVYSNAVGVFWGLLAMYIAGKALSHPSISKGIALLIAAYIVGSLSVLIKSTYIIILLAISIACVLHFLSRVDRWPLLVGLPLLFVSHMVSKLPVAVLEHVTGQKFGNGMPMTAWVAIGLREEPPTGPGWWTDFAIKEYRYSGGDYELQSVHFKETIKSLLDSFGSDYSSFTSFFIRKVSSEWAEPTFQTALYSSQGDRVVSGGLEKFILVERGYRIMVGFDNVMQSIVYFLALIGIFITLIASVRHKVTCNPMLQMLTITFLGGFLCYLFWEAKSVYALPFYLLLLPIAALGGQYINSYMKPYMYQRMKARHLLLRKRH